MTNPTPPGQVPDALRFTKRPVTIEAIQWTGKNLREVITFTDGPPDTRSHHAGMAWEAYADLVARDGLMIYTLEDGPDRRAKHFADIGDWIIRGVKGEYYPCKPDIFEATYDRAAHVQNPAEIEHVAGDVSKNGAEVNTTTAQQPRGAARELELAARAVVAADDAQSLNQNLIERLRAALRTQQPAPATQQAGEVEGWLTWFRTPSGGREPNYSHGAKKPTHGAELDAILTKYPVFAEPQPSPTAQAASSTVLKAIREANMQLVRTGDNAFMLVPYKVATAQATESVPAQVLDSLLNIVINHEARATPAEVRSMAAELATYRAARARWGQPSGAGEVVAWRLRITAFRSEIYEYFNTKYLAECRQKQFNASVDDGGLHDLTPLYATPPTAQAEGWRPIETAPKDGTYLLLWEQYSTNPFVGCWAFGVWAVSHEHVDAEGGWDGANVVDSISQERITHWMPLPHPPTSAEGVEHG